MYNGTVEKFNREVLSEVSTVPSNNYKFPLVTVIMSPLGMERLHVI